MEAISPYGAAGSLAGYLWQVRRAFITLLRGDFGDVLQIETVDDIVVVRGGRIAIAAQAKHSFNDGQITLAGVEWWRTLRVWIDLIERRLIPEDAELILCTTAAISQEMAMFAEWPRSADSLPKLITLHDRLAADRPNDKILKAYDCWAAAPGEIRQRIVAHAVIEPGQPRLANCHAEVDNELRRFGIPAGPSLDMLRNRLVGWFQQTLEERLTTAGCAIKYEELNNQLSELRFELNPRALPCAHSQAPAPPLGAERESDPTYLRQLDLLNASDEALAFAVSMYHRATAERDFWLQGRITAHGALKAYDADLVNAWRQRRERVERNSGGSTETERGWSLYDACMDYRGAVNGVGAPTHVASGTLHILANQPPESPQIGWHPRYAELLRMRTL